MRVAYSKDFEKSVRRLSGKMLNSVKEAIIEVKTATSISDITNCKKLVDYNYIYRIRIGDYRAFFIFHIDIADDVIQFKYLISRGEAYSKKVKSELRKNDK